MRKTKCAKIENAGKPVPLECLVSFSPSEIERRKLWLNSKIFKLEAAKTNSNFIRERLLEQSNRSFLLSKESPSLRHLNF